MENTLGCNIREQGPWVTAKWRNRNCRPAIATYFKYWVHWTFHTLDIKLCLRATLVSREELKCLYIILPLCQCCSGQQNQHQISADDPTRKLHHPMPMSVSHSTTITTYHVNRGILIVNYHFTVQGLIIGNKWSYMFPSIIWYHYVTLWSSMHGKETHKTA